MTLLDTCEPVERPQKATRVATRMADMDKKDRRPMSGDGRSTDALYSGQGEMAAKPVAAVSRVPMLRDVFITTAGALAATNVCLA